MTDYYGGPCGGIANFHGILHAYASQFEEDEYGFGGTTRTRRASSTSTPIRHCQLTARDSMRSNQSASRGSLRYQS
jgi:hypothetical protein